jgi:hypothetical protein
VDAVGSDLNDVEGLSVPRYSDIVRTAKSLERSEKKNIKIVTNQ